MPFLGGDAKAMRRTAASMERRSDDLERSRAALKATLHAVQWRGRDGDAFRAHWEKNLEVSLRTACQLLHDLASELVAQAQAQEHASDASSGAAHRSHSLESKWDPWADEIEMVKAIKRDILPEFNRLGLHKLALPYLTYYSALTGIPIATAAAAASIPLSVGAVGYTYAEYNTEVFQSAERYRADVKDASEAGLYRGWIAGYSTLGDNISFGLFGEDNPRHTIEKQMEKLGLPVPENSADARRILETRYDAQ